MKKFCWEALLCALLYKCTLTSAIAEPRSGEDVYKAKCAMCHGSGAKGVPRIGDIAGWIPIIEKGNEALYARMITDFKGHPPKGLCKDCTDGELKAAVDYMIQSSQ